MYLPAREEGSRQDEQREEDREDGKTLGRAGEHTVVPSEYCELVQPGDKVPARSRVAGDEDANGEEGEGVHVRRW